MTLSSCEGSTAVRPHQGSSPSLGKPIAAHRTRRLLAFAALGIVMLGLPTVAKAQTTEDENERASSPEPQEDERTDVGLPANVTVTTADGSPPTPEQLQEIAELIASDPELGNAAKGVKARTVRRTVDGLSIVITGRRLRGAVFGDTPPIRTLGPLDIRAYGASSVSNLLEALGGEVGSAVGGSSLRPLTLLNGRRILNFSEVARYPTEAIERLEIFPEELALRYGLPTDRKVVNIVTFNPYTSTNLVTALSLPTDGGRAGGSASVRWLRLKDGRRFAVNLFAEGLDELRLADRDLGRRDEMRVPRIAFLLPEQRTVAIDGSFLTNLGDAFEVGANFGYGYLDATSAFGSSSTDLIRQRNTTHTADLGASLSARHDGWALISLNTVRGLFDNISVFDPSGKLVEEVPSQSMRLASDNTLVGSLAELPAGNVIATFRMAIDQESVRYGDPVAPVNPPRDGGYSLSSLLASTNLTVPVVDTTIPFLDRALDLSAELKSAVRNVGNFQTHHGFGLGFQSELAGLFSLRFSYERTPTFPDIQELGSANFIVSDPVFFDYADGSLTTVDSQFGGNPNLRPGTRIGNTLSVATAPDLISNVVATATYSSFEDRDAVEQFPDVNPTVQEAFPARFVRDAAGGIELVDSRPLNIYRSYQSNFRWGLSFNKPFGSSSDAKMFFSTEPDGSLPPGTLPPNSRVIDSPPGTALPPALENAISRIYGSFYHTVLIDRDVQLSEGAATLDILGGDSLRVTDRISRHAFELVAGVFRRGLGGRAVVRWQTPSRIDTRLVGESAALTVRYLPVIEFSLFVNPSDRFRLADAGFFDGMQITIGFRNLLNARPIITDDGGLTPLGFEPALLDPVGRTLELQVRKVF